MKKPKLDQVVRFFLAAGSTAQLAKVYFDRYQNNGWTVTRMPCADTSWRCERKPMKRWESSAKAFIQRNSILTQNRLYRRA